MSSGPSVGDIIAISGLAFKVHAAYKSNGGDYSHISEEVEELQILIAKAAQHFKNTTISSDDHCYGRRIFKGCLGILEELNSLIEKFRSLASKNRKIIFTTVKLGKEDILSLREKLISNTILLKGFVRRFVFPGILLYKPYGY